MPRIDLTVEGVNVGSTGQQSLIERLQYVINAANGTGTGAANRYYLSRTVSLADSASATLDLTALTGAMGETLNLAGLQGLVVFASAANTGNLTCSIGASNGLALLGSAWQCIMSPGSLHLVHRPDRHTVDSTHKTITFANASGAAQVFDVFMYGLKS